MQLAPGTVLDRYTIEDVLGVGGMAVVYRVRHTQLGSIHAMKVLKVPTAAIRDRLLQEGRVQAQLRHPNIVSVTDVVDVGGSPGLVMEFIGGSSLDAFLADHRLTIEQADALARGILEGVAAAHHAGLIHRDLKPANILLGTAGGTLVPKITDFGLAKLVEGDEPAGHLATRSGTAMGTPAYMAPEQMESAKGVDQRADVFSLGAILYELVTGTRPFVGATTLKLLNAVATGDRVPLAVRVPDLPARMGAAIDGALTVDLAARVPTCDVLLDLWTGEAREVRAAAAVWDRDTVSQIERAVAPALHARSPSDEGETYFPGVSRGPGSLPSFGASLPVSLAAPPPETPAPQTSRVALLAVGLCGALLGLLVVLALAVGLGARPDATAGRPPLPATGPALALTPLPAPVADTDAVAQPAPVDVPGPTASPRPRPAAGPAPEVPAPEAPSDGDAPIVDFLSDPPGATVQIDGLTVGTTPLTGYGVPKGRYKVTMALGEASITERIGVSKRSGRRYTWAVGPGTWTEEE